MNDLFVTLAVTLAWLALASTIVGRRDVAERRYLWASFFAHQAAALANVVVTIFYYGGGDMTAYYTNGKFIADRLRADFFELAPTVVNVILQREAVLPFPGTMVGSNTGSIQAVSGFLMYFFQDSLYATCAVIAGASFLARVAVYDVFRRELPNAPRGLLCFACLLVPSTVFWSSGLLKEPIAMLGLSAMICGGYALAVDRRFVYGAFLFGSGLLVAGLFKGYLVPVFGIAGGMWLLSRAVQQRLGQVVLRTRYVVSAVAIGVAALILTGALLPQFAPEMLAEEARRAQEIGARIEGGSNYDLGSSGSIGAQLPLAVATVLFRPMLIEVSNPLILLNALEMSWLTVMVAIALFRRSLVTTLQLIVTTPALAFCVGFTLIMSVGVGLTTTNLGTLSRYRMPMMSFYAVLLVALASWAPPRRVTESGRTSGRPNDPRRVLSNAPPSVQA